MYPPVDTSGSESGVSSSEASEDCVPQEVESDTFDNDNIPLAKIASNIVTVLAMNCNVVTDECLPSGNVAYFAKLNSS